MTSEVEYLPVNPVDQMFVGDIAVGADGKRYELRSVYYPCERCLVLCEVDGDGAMTLPLSEARVALRPEINRAENMYEARR